MKKIHKIVTNSPAKKIEKADVGGSDSFCIFVP